MRLILSTAMLTAHLLAAASSLEWQMLTAAAAEESGYKRAPAISALTTIRSPEADKLVVKALTDKDLLVRFAAVSGLADRKSRADIPKLKTLGVNGDRPSKLGA